MANIGKKKWQNWVNVIVQTEMLAAVKFWSWNVVGCHSSYQCWAAAGMAGIPTACCCCSLKNFNTASLVGLFSVQQYICCYTWNSFACCHGLSRLSLGTRTPAYHVSATTYTPVWSGLPRAQAVWGFSCRPWCSHILLILGSLTEFGACVTSPSPVRSITYYFYLQPCKHRSVMVWFRNCLLLCLQGIRCYTRQNSYF